jgi:ABC-2 type transport system permease protein
MITSAKLATRQIRRGGLIVLVLVSGLSAVVVIQYQYTFADPAQVASLGVLAQNPAIRVLFGTPVALDNAGGFTVWRTGTFAAVTVASWGLLMATRITRGEEQAGRWALLLTGRHRLPSVLLHHLAVLLGAQIVIGCALALALILAGSGTRGSLIYGAGIALVGALFVAVGTWCAQLVDERRTASAIATAVLGVSLLIRMVADGAGGLAWLGWFTPFGLLGEAEPYAANRLLPLVVMTVVVLAAGGLSGLSAAHRDVGSGLITGRATRHGRFRLLRSLPGFAIRRTLPSAFGWAIGLGGYFLLIGLLARSLTDFLTANPRFAELAAQAGFAGLTTVQGYAAALFVLLAIPLGVFAASRLSVDAADEANGRLNAVFSRPLSRIRWSLVHLCVVVWFVVALAAAVGLATVAGTAVVGANLRVTEALAGTLNVVPVALLCIGAAQLAVGWMPRAVLPVGATPAAGGFLLTVLTQTFGWPDWLAQLSPFAHLGSVPATSPDWAGAAGMMGVAALLASLGIAGFVRRDLRG